MNRQLSYFDFVMAIISSIIGIGILSLPRRASEGAGVDGIISTILAGIFFSFLAYLFSKFSNRFQNQTILEASKSLGKYITSLLAIYMTIYFILIISLQLRSIGHSVKQNLLYNTPLEIIILSLLIVVAIAVNNSFYVLSKLASFFTIFTILILLFILISDIPRINIENLYPILSSSVINIIKTSFKLTLDYIGFEIILFITPFLASIKRVPKFSIYPMLIVTLIYTFTVTISFGEFGVIPNQYIIEPASILPKALSLGQIPFRIDIMFILFWIIATFLSMSFMLYMGSYSLSKITYNKDYRVFTFLSLPFIYVLSLIPQNLAEEDIVVNTITYMAWFGVYPIMAVLYAISYFKNRKNKLA